MSYFIPPEIEIIGIKYLYDQVKKIQIYGNNNIHRLSLLN